MNRNKRWRLAALLGLAAVTLASCIAPPSAPTTTTTSTIPSVVCDPSDPIVELFAPVDEDDPDVDLSFGATESDTCGFFLVEREVDTSQGELILELAADLVPGMKAVDGMVRSHLLHWDAVGTTSPQDGADYFVEVTFDDPVVGFVYSDTGLDATDARLGAPGVTYWTSTNSLDERNIERSAADGPCTELGGPQEYFEVLPGTGGRTIRACGATGVEFDELRVLTSQNATIVPIGPVDVDGTATALSAGSSHSCAVVATGRVQCWGDNSYGQLGNGSGGPGQISRSAVDVVGVSDATTVAAGGRSSCALLTDRSVKCWGDNAFGQLGDGTTVNSLVPVPVVGLTDVVAIESGEGSHTCALRGDGSVWCWGGNSFGALGNGTTQTPVPMPVTGISDASDVAVGANHTCAVLSDGAVRCWGYNNRGRLGDGSTTSSGVPVTVTGVTGAVRVDAGNTHTCIVGTAGDAECWGDNRFGNLGNGTTTDSLVAAQVLGLSDVESITGGYWNSCSVLSTGAASCWGAGDYGALGTGATPILSSTPLQVVGLADVMELDAGRWFACALLSTGGISCWGTNAAGQLGDGTTDLQSAVPVGVVGLR